MIKGPAICFAIIIPPSLTRDTSANGVDVLIIFFPLEVLLFTLILEIDVPTGVEIMLPKLILSIVFELDDT